MVKIHSESLKLYLETILNKSIKNIILDDLDKVTVLVFDKSMDNDDRSVFLDDIFQFNNVDKVVISNAMVSKENIELLKHKKIKAIRFNKCAFEDDTSIAQLDSLNSLEMIKSYNDSYEFLSSLNNLEFLSIANPYTEEPINMTYISGMKNLRKLILQKCILDDFECIINCQNINYLDVLWSDLSGDLVDVFNNMKNLNKLYISNCHNLNGINTSISIKNDLIDMLFDDEEDAEMEKSHQIN